MLSKTATGVVLFALVVMLAMFGCAQEEQETETAMEEADAMRTAVAQMNPTEGNTAHGTVTFTEVEGGIRVVAHFENVPEGPHGFHIHEYGDCSAPDATSAGGHFNPEGVEHAGREAEKRHVGDLGNITANAEGIATAEFVDDMLTFDGEHSIIGKGVILHAEADDLTTQPTGAAGARIACGVIELQNGEPMTEKQ